MDTADVIFIIGSGRSGTTLLYNLLATHPEVAWFSVLSNRSPDSHWRIRAHRLLDAPLVGERLKRAIVHPTRWGPFLGLVPSEGQDIYEGLCGLRQDGRSTEEDWEPEVEERLKGVMDLHLRLTGRDRFLSKRTSNTQRLRLVARMFPDASYIHIIRDGRAVALSYRRVEWWPRTHLWWAGTTPEGLEAEGQDPLEVAALHWSHNVEEVLGNARVLANYQEVRYEDLVADPVDTVMGLLGFCRLREDDAFMARLPRSMPDMNRKWRTAMDARERKVVEETAGGTLARLGYVERRMVRLREPPHSGGPVDQHEFHPPR